MEKSTTQVLQEARALVEKGWTQGPYYALVEGQDCYCASGAILRAAGTDFAQDPFPHWKVHPGADRALNRAARQITHGKIHNVTHYNEQRGRKKEHILHLFDVALEIASK